jgi:hypothetical protein
MRSNVPPTDEGPGPVWRRGAPTPRKAACVPSLRKFLHCQVEAIAELESHLGHRIRAMCWRVIMFSVGRAVPGPINARHFHTVAAS